MGEMYNLIPSQENIYLLVKFSFHKQIVQIPSSICFDYDIDFQLMLKALNIEIERNDCMRLRFKEVDGAIKEYFLPEYKVKSVPVLTFATEAEQNRFFDKDAQTPVYFLKDECWRIFFFRAYNGYSGIYVNVSHLVMDAMGIFIFYSDLMAVYKALKTGSELPPPMFSYEDYIKKEHEKMKNTARLEKSAAFYKSYFAKGGEPVYAGIHGPKFLERERRITHKPALKVPSAYSPVYDKSAFVILDIDAEKGQKILNFCKEKGIAPEMLFILAMRTYCSARNYRTPDVFCNLMCSKRITYKDMRMGGCVAQTLQIRTIIPETATFAEALEECTSVRNTLFRNLNYPFTYARGILLKMYNHKVTQGASAFMVSWLPFSPEAVGNIDMEFRTYNLGRYFNPLYAITSPNPHTGGITINYMYRYKLVSEKNVRSFHKNAVDIIMKGIENPDITVRELLNGVTE